MAIEKKTKGHILTNVQKASVSVLDCNVNESDKEKNHTDKT